MMFVLTLADLLRPPACNVKLGECTSVTFFTFMQPGHTSKRRIFEDCKNFNISAASFQCATAAAFRLCTLMFATVERNVTPLQHDSMLLSVLGMVVSAATEAKRLKVILCLTILNFKFWNIEQTTYSLILF